MQNLKKMHACCEAAGGEKLGQKWRPFAPTNNKDLFRKFQFIYTTIVCNDYTPLSWTISNFKY